MAMSTPKVRMPRILLLQQLRFLGKSVSTFLAFLALGFCVAYVPLKPYLKSANIWQPQCVFRKGTMDSATYGQHRAAVDVDFRIRQGACSQDVSIVANLTVVTALSSNHFSTFYAIFWPSLVESIHNQSLPLAARIIVYDLGLTSQERSLLERLEGVSITEARQFPYHQYPSYLNVKKARGEYAWKPVIVEQVSHLRTPPLSALLIPTRVETIVEAIVEAVVKAVVKAIDEGCRCMKDWKTSYV